MKSFVFSWLLLILSADIKAQAGSDMSGKIIPEHLNVSRYIPEWIEDGRFCKLYLKVAFADSKILYSDKVIQLKNAIIKSVDLVYTGYPADSDLSALNARRIKELHGVCPEAFENSFTTWRIVRQTDCSSEKEARKLYHGFVIVYQPAYSAEAATKEYSFLKAAWHNRKALKDTSLLSVFRRNKWRDMTVVTDMTGSMSPYISQVLLWYHLTLATKRIKEFVFFNDGDRKEDHLKVTGNTGGIYYCNSGDKEKVFQTAATCMKNGYGGDIQENNIEALLYATKKNPKQKELILIADNWSPMRDYELLHEVEVPVRIVICGLQSGEGLNTQYLDLARATGGSVHTVEMDIDHLSELAEGKTITILKKKYKVKNGKFILVSGL